MTILVVGATGATGQLLVEQLLRSWTKRKSDCEIPRKVTKICQE